MSRAILTLQVPLSYQDIPVAITARPQALRVFRECVMDEWREKIENADDEMEAALYRLEYDRLERAFALLIPNNDLEWIGV